jgi:hypothetical protein
MRISSHAGRRSVPLLSNTSTLRPAAAFKAAAGQDSRSRYDAPMTGWGLAGVTARFVQNRTLQKHNRIRGFQKRSFVEGVNQDGGIRLFAFKTLSFRMHLKGNPNSKGPLACCFVQIVRRPLVARAARPAATIRASGRSGILQDGAGGGLRFAAP